MPIEYIRELMLGNGMNYSFYNEAADKKIEVGSHLVNDVEHCYFKYVAENCVQFELSMPRVYLNNSCLVLIEMNIRDF